MNDSAERTDPQRRQEFFFWCCAAVSLLSLLGSHALFWLEPRLAEAAREITVTGRWYPFTVNFEPCGGLPPLEVWSTALFLKLGVSEFSARMPSVLAAFALLIGTFRLANRLFDRRTALLSCWLTLGSFGVLYMGRCCVPGIFPAALAVWAVVLYLDNVEKRGFRRAALWSFLLTLGTLNCGIRFLLIAGVLLIPWMCADRRGVRNWREPAAVVLAVGVPCLAWALLLDDPFGPAWDKLRHLAADGVLAETLKNWGAAWLRRDGNPAWEGLCNATLVIMPWILVTVTSFGGALRRMRRLESRDRRLLIGVVLGILVLGLGKAQRADYLPLVPFLALGTGVCVLRGDGGRPSRWAVVATRSAFIVAASFGVVSPVTIPLWRRVLNLDLSLVFWIACFLFGAAVLLIMMLDSYPKRPLSRLAGLPDPLSSTILGGTLTSICLMSFLLPSVREVRVEKAFLVEVKEVFAGRIPEKNRTEAKDGFETEKDAPAAEMKIGTDARPAAVFNVGRRDFAEMILFYVRLPERVTTISPRDGKPGQEELVRELLRHPGKRVAVIARFRSRDKDFLRGAAALAGVTADVDDPAVKEEIKYIYSELRANDENESPAPGIRFLKHACWLVTVPESAAENDSATNVRK